MEINLLQFSVSHHSSFCSKVSGPNEELDRLKELITSLESSLNELRSERNLQNKSLKIPSEASFKFEKSRVSEFFKTVGNYQESELFLCGGVQWRLAVECKLVDGSKSLGFWLRCEHNDSKGWFCYVDFHLILFSKLPDNSHCVRSRPGAFIQNLKAGFNSFVSYSELTNKSNGYIADDKITLGVEMSMIRLGASPKD